MLPSILVPTCAHLPASPPWCPGSLQWSSPARPCPEEVERHPALRFLLAREKCILISSASQITCRFCPSGRPWVYCYCPGADGAESFLFPAKVETKLTQLHHRIRISSAWHGWTCPRIRKPETLMPEILLRLQAQLSYAFADIYAWHPSFAKSCIANPFSLS